MFGTLEIVLKTSLIRWLTKKKEIYGMFVLYLLITNSAFTEIDVQLDAGGRMRSLLGCRIRQRRL